MSTGITGGCQLTKSLHIVNLQGLSCMIPLFSDSRRGPRHSPRRTIQARFPDWHRERQKIKNRYYIKFKSHDFTQTTVGTVPTRNIFETLRSSIYGLKILNKQQLILEKFQTNF
jgi:hypothetical protein